MMKTLQQLTNTGRIFMKPNKVKKTIKAWIITDEDDPTCTPYSVGKMYPIFYTKKDAETWGEELIELGSVVRECQITIILSK